jgi:hypothetical protein
MTLALSRSPESAYRNFVTIVTIVTSIPSILLLRSSLLVFGIPLQIVETFTLCVKDSLTISQNNRFWFYFDE